MIDCGAPLLPTIDLPPDTRQVLLFSGHRVDTPQRAQARFPPALVPAVARCIAEALDQLGAGAGDVAFSQCAAGSDLLFIDACLQRGVRCIVLLPEDEGRFIEHSILTSCDGPAWRARWLSLRERLAQPPRILPHADCGNCYERCNRWLLASSLSAGADRLRLLCVWDCNPGDGPGGVDQLVEDARPHTSRIDCIDLRALQDAGAPAAEPPA